MEGQPQLLVDGRSLRVERSIDVFNPSTGEVWMQCPAAGPDELDAAVAAARRAFSGWRATSIENRRGALLDAAQTIANHADELVELFAGEHGRPKAGIRDEILGAAYWMREIASLDLPETITEDSETRRIVVVQEPLGVVCAIAAWNFPVMLAIFKIAPALLAGNTVVLKPSPYTPLCTLRIVELIHGHFPPGVLNVLAGGDELGPLMSAHPGFAKITFTGSTATGKRVMEAAARDLKRVTLELGGNDAAIVLPDVDLDAVATKLFFGAFANTAQICVAIKRLYVHDDIYDALRDRLLALAQQSPLGSPDEPGVVFGPVQNAAQFRRVTALIEEARTQGLQLLQGAEAPATGYFVPLTIVDNPPENSRVVQEEAFGPVLPMLRFRDLDDVIARANATPFGLAGSVWTRDIAKGLEIAQRLETGTVWINDALQSTPKTPFAGHKQSGIGIEHGLAGLLEFTQPKAIYIPKSAGVAS